MRAKRYRNVILGLLLCVLVAWCLWSLLKPEPPLHISSTLSIREAVLGSDITGFQRVLEPRPFVFPADYGPHREYQTEWWYYTGNLRSADGREWGYQLTFFRSAMTTIVPERESAWGTMEGYQAHFTLSNIASQTFTHDVRASRGGAMDLAGAQSDPYHIFVEDWSAIGSGDRVTLGAQTEGVSLTLELETLTPPTLQGDRGLSQKAPEAGAASYYYSYPHMATQGVIMVNNAPVAVEGTSWFDHEWGTGTIGDDHGGWDWFGLHLEDGRELMWFQLRRMDGSVDHAMSQGSITVRSLETDSEPTQVTTIRLHPGDVQVNTLGTWTSPRTRVQYPRAWQLQIPSQNLTLSITPLLENQELTVGLTYWEGAVQLENLGPTPIVGRGYVELAGYADIRLPPR